MFVLFYATALPTHTHARARTHTHTHTHTHLRKRRFGLDLLWGIIQDDVPVGRDIMVKATEFLLRLLERNEFHAERGRFMDMCVDNVRSHTSVPQSLEVLQAVIATFPQRVRAWKGVRARACVRGRACKGVRARVCVRGCVCESQAVNGICRVVSLASALAVVMSCRKRSSVGQRALLKIC